MNFFGTYHTDVQPQAMGICDAPQISRGQMILSAFETASDAQVMALCVGRLRNRAALARELECASCCSQAELILRAYQTWGDTFIERVEGACLCCIADIERDRMLVVRDRLGEIPVFFAWKQGGMVFADHPDMILRSGFIAPVAGRTELCELFGLGPARTPGRTFIRDLQSLPAGHVLTCERGEYAVHPYWEPPLMDHNEDEADTVAHTRELLNQCVEDVVQLHPACMLSGGLDSTALTALLSTRIGRLESFSVDYRGNDLDFVANDFRPEMDAPYIQLAVRTFGTRHRQVLLEQENLVEALGDAVQARGFPGMADIDSSLLLFAREIARHAPYVVSGECGDEVFGGYPWFREGAQLPENSFPWSGSMELRENILKPELRQKLKVKDYVTERLHEALDSYDVSGVAEAQKDLFRMQRLCFDYFMANLQERVVQMCGVHGLTVLTPLCDDRLLSYVYNVPWHMKRMGGMEKGLFRAAMADLLPDRLRIRKKSPYPKTCSSVYSTLVSEKIRMLMADSEAPLWSVVDRTSVERIVSSKLNPAEMPWFGQLMAGPQLLAYLQQINQWMQERNVVLDL